MEAVMDIARNTGRTFRFIGLAVALVLIAAVAVGAQTKSSVPLAGRWEGTRTGEGGQTEPVALVFDVKENSFTGTMFRSGREFGRMTDGKIDGAKITFKVQDIDFEGEIDGASMKVTVIFINSTQEFTVTKKSS
jgi:hypothetical protein